MALFPSKQWLELFKDEINGSEAYRTAARKWEGSFIFVIEADNRFRNEGIVFVDLWHGTCREVRVLSSLGEIRSDYVWRGRYSDWYRLLKGELDAPQGVVSGKFQVSGSVMTLLSRGSPFAANELVVCARKVPTEFPA